MAYRFPCYPVRFPLERTTQCGTREVLPGIIPRGPGFR